VLTQWQAAACRRGSGTRGDFAMRILTALVGSNLTIVELKAVANLLGMPV
jgi:hypothetical protein